MNLTKDMLLDFDNKKRIFTVGKYSVSECVGCHQKMYYKRTQYIPVPRTPPMALGNIFHKVVPYILKDKSLKYEVRMSSNYGEFELIGTADAVDNENIYEFKFSRLRSISNMAISQANMYCGLSSRKKGTVFMVHPVTLNVLDESFDFNDVDFQELLSKIENVHLYLSQYPDVKPRFAHSPAYPQECERCVYSEICPIREGRI